MARGHRNHPLAPVGNPGEPTPEPDLDLEYHLIGSDPTRRGANPIAQGAAQQAIDHGGEPLLAGVGTSRGPRSVGYRLLSRGPHRPPAVAPEQDLGAQHNEQAQTTQGGDMA